MTATAIIQDRTMTRESTMLAITQDRFGSADVLGLTHIDRPRIGAGDVLVRVRAAAIHAGDWHLMTGLPYLVRLMGYGLRRPKNPVRGLDVAGVVESVGTDVTRFQPGDEVFGWCDGSLAEFARASQSSLLPKPARLTFEQASAVAMSGMTALQAVRDSGKVQAGQQVLVTGAAGGVGSFAVQIARAFGAEVTGVSSTAKLGTVSSLGADHVIDYTATDFTRSGERYDVIIDTAGRRPLRHLRRALTPDGTLVLVGGEGGDRLLGGFDRQIRGSLQSHFVRQNLRMLVSAERPEDLEALAELIEEGKVTPLIDRTFPLAEASDAFRHLAAGASRGKTVVTI